MRNLSLYLKILLQHFLCLQMKSLHQRSVLIIPSIISMFHHAFFNSIIDKHQHMHFFTFKTVLV